MSPGSETASLYSRRSVLTRLACGGLATCAGNSLFAREEKEDEITFFVMADPQIHLEKWGVAGTESTLKFANALPGKPFPFGGKVEEPRAVLVLGDLVDEAHDRASWETYKKFFDPNGENSLLRFRAFEGIGNHDLSSKIGPGELSPIEKEFIERNKKRRGPETFNYDPLNYHYSWNWGPLHLIQLNLFPGNEPRPVYDGPAPWNNPRKSLDVLKEDLEKRVGDSGRPVVLMWHYGLRGWGLEKWWSTKDLENLKKVIEPYNVVLILHGHEHAFAKYEWEGYPVFMSPSPQRDRDPKTPEVDSTSKGFLVVRLKGSELQLVHNDAGEWREQWSREISLGREAAGAR